MFKSVKLLFDQRCQIDLLRADVVWWRRQASQISQELYIQQDYAKRLQDQLQEALLHVPEEIKTKLLASVDSSKLTEATSLLD